MARKSKKDKEIEKWNFIKTLVDDDNLALDIWIAYARDKDSWGILERNPRVVSECYNNTKLGKYLKELVSLIEGKTRLKSSTIESLLNPGGLTVDELDNFLCDFFVVDSIDFDYETNENMYYISSSKKI